METKQLADTRVTWLDNDMLGGMIGWMGGGTLRNRIRAAQYRLGTSRGMSCEDGMVVVWWVVQRRDATGPMHYFETEKHARTFLWMCAL
jgi:hypothetical protein